MQHSAAALFPEDLSGAEGLTGPGKILEQLTKRV
jgi:hypothetical protein